MAEENLVRATTLSGYADKVAQYGQDPVRLMECAGLSPLLLQEPDLFMPFSRFMLLLDLTAQETGSSMFGAELGMEQGLRVLGAVAYGMSTSVTLREAFVLLRDNHAVQSTGNVTRLQVFDNQHAMLSTEIISPATFDARQTLDNTVAVGIRMMQVFYGAAWKPSEVLFQHSLPAKNRAAYRRLFGENIQFDADVSGFVSLWWVCSGPGRGYRRNRTRLGSPRGH